MIHTFTKNLDQAENFLKILKEEIRNDRVKKPESTIILDARLTDQNITYLIRSEETSSTFLERVYNEPGRISSLSQNTMRQNDGNHGEEKP
jgi:hypothetical protein